MKKGEGSATDPPDTGGSSRPQNPLETKYNFKIGIYGWRKRCFYVLILILLIMVIINLALTLWVLKVMEFSAEGMGKLKIVSGGLKLEGKAFVLDRLIASSFKSRTGEPIVIESSTNLTLSTRNKHGQLENMIFLGNDRFECLANNFKIMDDRGVILFSVDHQKVYINPENFEVSGKEGTSIGGSIQTSLVRAKSGHDLRLESPTRSLEMRAPQNIHIEARGGTIDVISFKNIDLKSTDGAIKLDSKSIVMPSLPTAVPLSKPREDAIRSKHIFQLCVCDNGKLFLAQSNTICSAVYEEGVCR